MTLSVHHSAHLDVLADVLARVLADPVDDPFVAEVVAVPTAGVRDWLKRALATRLGVAANLDLPFPRAFLSRALAQPVDHDDPWQIDRVAWAILEVGSAHGELVPSWPSASGHGNRFSIARRVADLFDRYAANRPALVQHWAAGVADDGRGAEPLPDSMRWQFDLWRLVRSRLGPHPAEDLPARLRALASGTLAPDLPGRVAMFGIGAFGPAQLDVVRALAHRSDVHLLVAHPSPAAWTAMAPVPPGPLAARRRRDDLDADDGNPLLRSWGRPTFETAALVRGAIDDMDAVVVDADAAPVAGASERATVLALVQRAVLTNRDPASGLPDRGGDVTDPGDRSVQIHACHGAVRQLEVLRDALDALFAADHTLQPHDVLVMTPDLERFEPLAATVMGRGTLPVPLTVSDLSLGIDRPVVAALDAILATLAGRCTAAEVLDLAGLDAVRRRLGFSTDDLEQFGDWVASLGARWGLDAEQRAEWGLADVLEGTWATVIDSLLLGVAVPAPVPRAALAAIVPFDDLGASEMYRVGRLGELLARLRHARQLTSGHHTIDEWCQHLVEILGLLVQAGPGEEWQMAALTASVERLRADATVAGSPSSIGLTLDEIRSALMSVTGTTRGRLRLRSGSVTLTGLVAVRNVPARVVCLLGLDEARLRLAGVDGDDVLGIKPCLGERDRRADARHALLDAVMAAGEHLIVTCDGSDITTNRRIRTPIQLAELIDAVSAVHALPGAVGDGHGDGDDPVIVRHPRRAYDERVFIDGTGFDHTMWRAASLRRTTSPERRARPETRFDQIVPAPVPAEVTVETLVEACSRPARILLRDTLDVRLPGEARAVDEHVPLEVSALDSSQMGRSLLDHLAERISAPGVEIGDVLDGWESVQRSLGRLPPRGLADHSLSVVRTNIDKMLVATVGDLHGGAMLGATGCIEVDEPIRLPTWISDEALDGLDGGADHVRLRCRIGHVHGTVWCDIRYERPKPRHELRAALTLAALVLAHPSPPWEAAVLAREPSGGGKKLTCHRWTVCDGAGVDQARALLEVAVDLRLRAARSRLALFERTSPTLHTEGWWDEAALFGSDYERGADLADDHASFVWGDITVDELEQVSPSPRHLAHQLWSAVERFATVDREAGS